MNALGLIGAYFTMFAAGFGVALLVMSNSSRLNVIESACLAWLFGTGVVSLTLWLGGIFVSGVALQSLVTALCLAAGIAGWQLKRRKQIHFFFPLPKTPVEWVLAGLLLVELTTLFFVSLKHTLGWDGLFNWELKARYAFLNFGVLPKSYYSGSGRAFSHPEYPLGIPFTELWLYLWMGSPHQFWIKTIFPLFYIAGTLLLALFVTRLSGERWLGLLIAFLVPFVPFVLASRGGFIVGYADIPLSFFYLAALGYLLCWLEAESPYSIKVYTGLATLVPWIKSEGWILFAILSVISLFAGIGRRYLRSAILSIVPGLILIAGWQVYLAARHTIAPSDFFRPTLQLLGQNLNRLGTITRITFIAMTDTSLWSIFWLLTLVAIVYLLVARRLSRVLLVAAILGPVILYMLSYIFSAWPSYTAHIRSSLPRLLLHVMPAAWLAIGLAFSQVKGQTQTL